MDDGELDYLPDEFRTSARANHQSADGAEELARRLRGVSAAPSQFGGSEAVPFTGSLNDHTDLGARRAEGAREDRDGIGEGGSEVADLGEETDDGARRALREGSGTEEPGNDGPGTEGSGSPASRRVTDGMA